MKNKQKPSNSPDSTPAHRRKIGFHIFRLTGFALGLSVLLTLFALLVIGLPPGLTRRITAELQAAGIPVQVQSIRLSTHRGWVLNDVCLYSTSPDDLQPLLTAKKLYFLPWPENWKHPSEGGWRINIYAKKLGVSLGQPWETALPNEHPFRIINRLDASLTISPGHIAVEHAELDWGGIHLLAHGNSIYSVQKKESGSPQGKDFRRRAAKAADALSQLKCEQPPQLNLNFNFNDTLPEETFLDASLSATGVTWNRRLYQQLTGSLTCRDSIWTLGALQLRQSDGEQLMLRGKIDLNQGVAQASIENTLSALDLLTLLPEETLSAVAQTGIKPYGKLNFTATAGPAPVAQLAEKIDVRIEQAQLTRQNITLDPLALHLARDGNRVEVDGIQAKVNGGPLAGNFKLNLDSSEWTAHVQTQCDPSIAGAYDEDLGEFISRFKFPGEYPNADLTLSNGEGDSVVMSGTLSGDQFTCGGVPIGHLEAFMTYSNQVVDLTPIHVVRTNEKFDGSVQVDFTRQLGIFNATNSFPPGDIARALAPDEHTILEAFHFDGPVYAAGQGQIDYGNWTNHLFKGMFHAENVSMDKLKVTLFNSAVEVRGTQLLFTNAAAQLYSGTVEGAADFDILLEDGAAPYNINARFSQIDLTQMLKELSPGDYGRTRGQLSTAFNITADAKAGFWKSVKGAGRIEIKDGHLADVPFLGGFSRLIQSTFSGFSLFSLTAFSADYELGGGAIRSENAQLGGTLVSARGRGNYSPETGLDFIVTAEPFRQTGRDKEKSQLQKLAADALRETTAPFFRLLEFQLEGPLDKPAWRFVNLPSLGK